MSNMVTCFHCGKDVIDADTAKVGDGVGLPRERDLDIGCPHCKEWFGLRVLLDGTVVAYPAYGEVELEEAASGMCCEQCGSTLDLRPSTSA